MPTTLALAIDNPIGMPSNLEYNAASAHEYVPEWGGMENDC
jgi:hypothetical protein